MATNTIPFEMLSEMRAALATAKIPAVLDLVGQYEENEEPVVVFSDHVAPVEALAARDGWKAIYGGDAGPEYRQKVVEEFQAGKLKGVACTIKAAGVGITLTRANTIIFVDKHWTPALNEQAEDRLARIGQTRPVNVITLAADHPLDKRIAELLTIKQEMVKATIEKAQAQLPAKSLFLQDLAANAPAVPERVVRVTVPSIPNEPGEFAPIVDALTTVRQHLKYPKLLVRTATGRNLEVQLCSERSKYVGQVRVVEDGGDNMWFGQIDKLGHASDRLLRAPADVVDVLRELAKNPAEFARAQGKQLGICCCCGAELENPESVANGIGPVCASKWGF